MGQVLEWQEGLDPELSSDDRLAQLDSLLDNLDWPTLLPEFRVKITVKAMQGLQIHEQITAKRIYKTIVPRYCSQEADEGDDQRAPHLRVVIGDQFIWLGLEASENVLYPRLSPARAKAALKENLAALVASCGSGSDDISLILDPMCGSGTLLLEAVASHCAIHRPIPRGLRLETLLFDHNTWQSALDQHELSQTQSQVRAVGYDGSADAIIAAKQNQLAFKAWNATAKAQQLHLERRDLATPWPMPKTGRTWIIMNPPYGKRLGASYNLAYFYQALGRKIQTYANSIVQAGGLEPEYTIISSDIELLDCLHLDYDQHSRFFNGPDQIFCRTGKVSFKELPTRAPLRATSHWLNNSAIVDNPLFVADLAHRLVKNDKKRARLLDNPTPSLERGLKIKVLDALGLDLSVAESTLPQPKVQPLRLYRLYNADLPEYNCAIDVYEHCVYLQEYKAPASVDSKKAAHRVQQIVFTLSQVLKIPAHRILTKARQRQLGRQQYTPRATQEVALTTGPLHDWHKRKTVFEMQEWGAEFIVNLGDYIDTGLFLDHRRLRWLIRQIAPQKHILNLFSYTGSFSVHAALAGAASTTSVDLSPTYVAWTEHNFMANGLALDRHKVIRADVSSWLLDHSNQYDVIIIDPPTFSNSKKAADFSVQEHHSDLIRQAMRHLQGKGVLFFSCNMKKFSLDASLMDDFQVCEISNWTQSADFQTKTGQNQTGGHRCWLFWASAD